MASAPRAEGEPATAHTFRGHPQPPPDERLQECKNYLADEDVNRKLNFTSQLSQIEEYIKDVEEKQLPCDKKLLIDVRTMAAVQREWLSIMDAPPCDKNSCKPDQNPPISNRLVSKNVRKALQDEKEAMGLANQTREDHAPFTIERQDQHAFLLKLKRDQSANPETIEEATNLSWVENRAYGWALREPSLIPVWLHPRLGLSKKGIKASDEDPWYRKDVRLSGIRRRPPPQILPDYLQHAQDTINALLQKFAKGIATEEQITQLEGFLVDFELQSLKKLRGHREHVLEYRPQSKDAIDVETITELDDEFRTAHKKWLSSFATDGIQFVVGRQPATHILQPGVFYLPEGQPSAEDLERLGRCEARANDLLQMSLEELEANDEARSELSSYLQPTFSPEMRSIMDRLAKLVAPVNAAERIEKKNLIAELYEAEFALLEPLLGSTIQLSYQRPGEMAFPSQTRFYIPWSPEAEDLSFDNVTLPSQVDENLRELGDRINNLLGDLEVYPGSLAKTDINEFERELEKVMYPELRKLRDLYLEARAQRSGRKADAEERDIKFEYDSTCRAWVNSFLRAGVQIRRTQPFKTPERPGLLYVRGHPAGLDTDMPQYLKILADSINRELRRNTQLQDNPEEQDLYRFLVNLQYPRLKKMDEYRRQRLRTRLDPTEDEIRAEQEAHKQWRETYNAWVASFRNTNVVCRLVIPRDTTLGDPSVVYYRGPLGRDILPETPETPGEKRDPPLIRRKVDHALFMLYWWRHLAGDKLALAARLEAVSCLPPSVIGRLNKYRAARASGASSDHTLAKENAAISAFSSWERGIRNEAPGFPTMPAAPAIPDRMQQEEKTINRLLETSLHSTGEELDRLNRLIMPYWGQLSELQERRRSRLRFNGVPEEEIARVDMGIDTFSIEFADFKARCRARGFKMITVVNRSGGFDVEAKDPDSEPYTPGTQRVVESLLELNLSDSGSPLDSIVTNDIREDMFKVQEEINHLLSIHRRPGVDAGGFGDSRRRDNVETSRLTNLLRPMFPRDIDRAWRLLQTSQIHKRTPAMGERKTDAIRGQNEAIRRFLDLYEPWIKRLETTKVHLVLGSKDNNLEDNVDGKLYVDYRGPTSDQTSDAEITTRRLSPEWRKVEAEINDLLALRRSRTLILAEEKRLRSLLRVIMPSGLASDDDRLRSLSQRARTGLLSAEMIIEYVLASDRWRDDYYTWLDEFAEKEVRLQKPVPGVVPSASPHSDVMVIRVDTPAKIPDDSMETADLPFHIKARQDLLDHYLAAIPLEPEERSSCQMYVLSMWRPYYYEISHDWENEIFHEYHVEPYSVSSVNSTRLQAVAFAQLCTSIRTFLKLVRSGSQKLKLAFVETQPETFSIELVQVKTDNAIQDEKMLRHVIKSTATIAETQGRVHKVLHAALKEFFFLSSKVSRRQSSSSVPPLTDEELQKVQAFLKPLSMEKYFAMERDIVRLLEGWSGTKTLSRLEEKSLQGLCVKQMWYAWGIRCPEIQKSWLGAVNQPDPVGYILHPMSPGAIKASPPAIDPPTKAEFDAVLDKVNHLFDKYARRMIQGRESGHLKHVLMPLMPVNLRNVEREMQRLQSKSVNPEGLTTNEGLKFAEFDTQFATLWEKWTRSFSNFDALLNTVWADHKAMQNFYTAAVSWDKATHASDEDRPVKSTSVDKDDGRSAEGRSITPISTVSSQPSNSIEQLEPPPIIKDDTLLDHQETREILSLFTENYEGNFQDRLLLAHMDPPLKELYEQIHALRDRERSNDLTFDDTRRLRTVTEEFARDYVLWYFKLTPEQIKTFRRGAIDFSAKAERRGVQRAAVELALNLFATNQEQHRPHERFRRLPLPPKHQPPLEEVPLYKPLDPWRRPLDLDPFYYTKLMRKFRRWKDSNYTKARNQTVDGQYGQVEPPVNYNGPFTLQEFRDMREAARKRANHLAQISALLLRTQETAPRPLLERMCTLIGEGIAPSTDHPQPTQDSLPLTTSDLDILLQLCEPSWALDEKQPYVNPIAGFPQQDPEYSSEKAKLDEFERDLVNVRLADNDLRHLLPVWRPNSPPDRQRVDPRSDASFVQRQYDKNVKSQVGTNLSGSGGLIERMNIERRARAERIGGSGQECHMWEAEEVQHFLQAMHDAGRIHFDKSTQSVSRVPHSGHPENRYVVSEEDAKHARYITFNSDMKKFQVQYDMHGTIGPPIVQPNKFQHFQQIASRLGRDIRHLTRLIADTNESDAAHLEKQSEALSRTLQNMTEIDADHGAGTGNEKEISLRVIARDLLKYAPELLQDIGLDGSHDITTITEDQAAKIIQLQLIEESNNNWESRFPEDEHVWDWVDDPQPIEQWPKGRSSAVAPDDASNSSTTSHQYPVFRKHFFSMRRWPVECQSAAVQTMIKASRPTFEVDTDPAQPRTKPEAPSPTAAQKQAAALGPRPRERYTGRGGPPNFPFGETPFQQAYQSFRITQDLADVPEFTAIVPESSNPAAPSEGLWGRLKRKLAEREPHQPRQPRPSNPFDLPEIPPEWIPTNVSVAQKRHDLVEKAKETPGFPDTDDAFYSPAEIALKTRRQLAEEEKTERERAKTLIVERAGKPLGQIWHAELRKLQDELNIDPITERVRPAPKTAPTPALRSQSVLDPSLMAGGLGQGDKAAAASTFDRVNAGMQALPGRNFRSKPPNVAKPKGTSAATSKPEKRKAIEDAGSSGIFPSRRRTKVRT